MYGVYHDNPLSSIKAQALLELAPNYPVAEASQGQSLHLSG